MEELRLWIKDLGFPVVSTVVLGWVVLQLFKLRESERNIKDDKVAVAIKDNTEATKALTVSLRGWGSDPFKNVCKASADPCKAKEVADVLERAARDRAVREAADAARLVVEAVKPKPA